MKLENINWDYESELPDLYELEDTYHEDCFIMSFDYNNQTIEATVEIFVKSNEHIDNGSMYSSPERFRIIDVCEVEVKEMYDKDYNEIILTVKEIKEINEVLTNEIEF